MRAGVKPIFKVFFEEHPKPVSYCLILGDRALCVVITSRLNLSTEFFECGVFMHPSCHIRTGGVLQREMSMR